VYEYRIYTIVFETYHVISEGSGEKTNLMKNRRFERNAPECSATIASICMELAGNLCLNTPVEENSPQPALQALYLSFTIIDRLDRNVLVVGSCRELAPSRRINPSLYYLF